VWGGVLVLGGVFTQVLGVGALRGAVCACGGVSSGVGWGCFAVCCCMICGLLLMVSWGLLVLGGLL
jgi:hypothetical protein